MKNYFLLFSVFINLSACHTIPFFKGSEPVANEEKAGSGQNKTTGTLDDLELKQAKLWARVDELEEKVSFQEQKLNVLKKGLMLGLIPEEMEEDFKTLKKQKAERKPTDEKPVEKSEPATKKEETNSEKKPEPKIEPEAKTIDETEYQKRLVEAQELYRNGQYGKAIAEFSAIGRDFKDRVKEGSHQFWIALCWSHLKEYQTARQLFAEYIDQYPASPWMPRAKLELARVEIKLGLKETALKHLQAIVSAYPYEDAGEMAKMEIEKLGQDL